jgi:antitoxin (DNA-binding transcriptional repressor) of toxin-antitoxin stability system
VTFEVLITVRGKPANRVVSWRFDSEAAAMAAFQRAELARTTDRALPELDWLAAAGGDIVAAEVIGSTLPPRDSG